MINFQSSIAEEQPVFWRRTLLPEKVKLITKWIKM